MKSILSAIGLLTIIPIPARWANNIMNVSVYFGLVGFLIGLIYYFTGLILMQTEMSSAWAAFIVIFIQIVLTRAFHLDGVADMADGFWGGKDKDHRLKIMKDSSIGTFGATSLFLLLLGKWIAIESIFEKKLILIFLISSIISRFSMTLTSGLFSYSRKEGTGHSVITNTGFSHISISIIYTALLLFFLSGPGCFLILFASISITLFIGLISYSKINGITGDILGATCEIVDMFILAISPYILSEFPLLFYSPAGIK